MDLQLNRDWIL